MEDTTFGLTRQGWVGGWGLTRVGEWVRHQFIRRYDIWTWHTTFQGGCHASGLTCIKVIVLRATANDHRYRGRLPDYRGSKTSETGWQRLCSKFLQIREREAVGILFIGLTADLRAVLQSCLIIESTRSLSIPLILLIRSNANQFWRSHWPKRVELSEVELTLSVVTFDIHLRSPKSPPKLLLNPVPLPPTISIPHPKQQMAQQMMGPQPDPPIVPHINSSMNSPAPSPTFLCLNVKFQLSLPDRCCGLATHNEQLVQLILSWEDETCPGTVVIFDKHYWMEEHALIDQLVLQYSRPLTLLQSFSNYGLLPDDDSWTGAGGSPLETLCNNIILFNRYPADLTTVYRQLTARYPYIGQVLVVTPSASEQVERFLYEFKNHKIMLVINRPWRHLELRNCCWGPDRRIRRVDLLPDSSVRWEEFGLRTSSRIADNGPKDEDQFTDPSV
ncbi:hypothetical protein DAPPUDRAFT_107423 [Daphnia pulex]|uniref:Uncharacterized protein n=1 Tax=Daphnia pulex TaxID=6669 RepID=E9GX19_DAPPU|nr:hypothetical protein DAPPUDRAFT_107423 [Daphnia pulex]|eukprot:EFX76014.1 hypothetical protein DAPPUDRAFT_107423 [Daphnia pulex]